MKACPACGDCFEDDRAACDRDGAELERTLPGSPILAGRYRLNRVIGRGGMGVVYEATHLGLERRVALKTLREPLSEPHLARLAREGRLLGRLRHPGVVEVTDSSVGAPAGTPPFLVLELLRGRPLSTELGHQAGSRRATVGRALEILSGVAAALDAAHAAGVLHRDIKPSNVFLVDGPEGGVVVKVVDFGLAAERVPDAAGADGSGGLTLAGRAAGTPAYLAPERALGGPATPASDIYSLAVLAFEVLSGRLPHEGDAEAVVASHVEDAPPRSRLIEAGVPEGVADALLGGLEKEPASRPLTATLFVSSLEAAWERERGAVRRRRLLRSAAPLSLLAAIGAALCAGSLMKVEALQALEDRSESLRFRLTPARPPDQRLVMVLLDEEYLRRDPSPLAQQSEPIAAELERILDSGAGVLALDLLLPESWSRSDAFRRLVLRWHERLVLAAYVSGDSVVGAECTDGPIANALTPAEGQRLFALVNLEGSSDGRVRRVRLSHVDVSLRHVPTLAARAAALMREGAAFPPGAGARLVDWSVSREAIPRIPLGEVERTLAASPDRFRGAAVLVGGTFAASGDVSFPLPDGERAPGVEVQAAALETLLSGSPYREPPARTSRLWSAALSGLGVLAGVAGRRRPLALATVLLAAAGVLAMCWRLGVVLPVAAPLVLLGAGFGLGAIWATIPRLESRG